MISIPPNPSAAFDSQSPSRVNVPDIDLEAHILSADDSVESATNFSNDIVYPAALPRNSMWVTLQDEEYLTVNGTTPAVLEKDLSRSRTEDEVMSLGGRASINAKPHEVSEVANHVEGGLSLLHLSSTSKRGAPGQPSTSRDKVPETFIKEDMQRVWSDCAKQVWEQQREIIDRWKDELNTLLIFAGLFSAVLTSFVIEYYSTLQPSTFGTPQILVVISALPEVFIATADHHNLLFPSMSALVNSSSATQASSQAIAVNGLWFAALVFSLGAASLAISVNQWLNHHRTRPLSMSRESAEIWYLRHRSLDRWKVPLIISVLPVLLQVSLALFLVGLVIQLWSLNACISTVVCGLVSLLLLGTIGTAFIPALVPDCAYKSPQAW
ncbi:uncharacterized protein FIBRA_00814 [Fibroporia radiculosa]|uniref:DUF6535 domain-containing protein n=1 Tax=Fibroporia radiculosa TaxID=599839 RepID=J4H0R5_9APHY|nr:uncharacterized protein FIBRA_00814 [Fibroporia radiculosa]CCL98809.1 predicted protein [Fibroporia radiculosa]